MLGACVFTAEVESTVENLVWVSSFAASPEDITLLARDVKMGIVPSELCRLMDVLHCGIGEDVYVSPSIAAWAPWLLAVEGVSHHGTLDAMGRPHLLSFHALCARVMYAGASGEEEGLLPAPILRDGLGIINGLGNATVREFTDSNGGCVASYSKLSNATDLTRLAEYLTISKESLQNACQQHGLLPAWHVRVLRQIPFPLMNEDNRPMPYESRLSWLILPNAVGDYESLLLPADKT